MPEQPKPIETGTDQEQDERPGYYGILPATVRYCNHLTPAAKILFTEITALSNKYGYCNAGNQYFATLYDKDPDTISRWIGQLKKEQFIRVEIDVEAGNKRQIYPLVDALIPIRKNADRVTAKKSIAIGKNAGHNNKPIIILSLKERKDSFFNRICDYRKLNPKKYPADLYNEFYKYWTETDPQQNMRFEDKKNKYFEIGKRLATFWGNVKIEEKNRMWRNDKSKEQQQQLFT